MSSTRGAIPPACAIATWLSAFWARFHSAPAARSFAYALPLRVSSTRGAIPPACAIATLLSAFTARFLSSDAACSCVRALPLRNSSMICSTGLPSLDPAAQARRMHTATFIFPRPQKQ